MYQQLTLIGNLGSDPELRNTATGVPVCTFRLAVNKQWHGQDGEQKEKVTWFRVTAWQKLAEVVNEHLRKGRRVLVVGELENPQAYLNKAGEPAATNEVTARTVRFLDTAADGDLAFEENSGSEPVAPKPVAAQPAKSQPAKAQPSATKARRAAIDIPF